jgi:hypothetical protein
MNNFPRPYIIIENILSAQLMPGFDKEHLCEMSFLTLGAS